MRKWRRSPSCSNASTFRLAWNAFAGDPKIAGVITVGAVLFGVGLSRNPWGMVFPGAGVVVLGMLLPIISEVELSPGKLKIKTIQRSRDEEFTPFMAAQRPHLERLAFLMVGHEETASELVDDALTRTYLAWRRLTENQRPRFVLCRLVHLALGRSVFRIDIDEPTPTPAIENDSQQIRLERSAHILSSVHPRHRMALLLKHYEGLGEIEIADMLEQPIEDVISEVHYAVSTVESAFALLEPVRA